MLPRTASTIPGRRKAPSATVTPERRQPSIYESDSWLMSIACLNNKLMTAAQQAVHDLLVCTIKRISDSLHLDIPGAIDSPARKVCPSSMFARTAALPRVVHRLQGDDRAG